MNYRNQQLQPQLHKKINSILKKITTICMFVSKVRKMNNKYPNRQQKKLHDINFLLFCILGPSFHIFINFEDLDLDHKILEDFFEKISLLIVKFII